MQPADPSDVDAEPRVPAPRQEPAPASASPALTEREVRILEFEARWWKHAGAKEQAIRDLFGLSATRYYQILNALIDLPAALEHDPMLVKRLRRLRTARQRARSARRQGHDA